MKKIKLLLFIFYIFMLVSCTKNDKAKIYTLLGYIDWKQNDWHEASSRFLTTIDIGDSINDEKIKMYASFGLGSVYLMQNEDSSAFLRLTSIKNSNDKNLNAAVYYQKGIIAFKKQDYKEAVHLFKKSLELIPENIDAKINFELSKRYLKKQDTLHSPPAMQAVQEKKDEDVFEKLIMNLIKKKEIERWERQEQHTPKQNSFDY